MNESLTGGNENSVLELRCTYKGEVYSVRNSGEILRHAPEGKRRRLDGQWTFGTPSPSTGYMEVAGARVHQIVATAFHGTRPTPGHVVDHIDTNRKNNRPENLRWVTRLENVLLNPITARRIVLRYGSIEAFLADPSQPCERPSNPNFDWMRTVSIEEAQISLKRLLSWAENERVWSGGSLGDWLFTRNAETNIPKKDVAEDPLINAITPGAVQRNWRIPSEFPCCPSTISQDPIASYEANLAPDSIFARNDLYMSKVHTFAMSADHGSIWVMTSHGKDAIKPWGLAKITFERGVFVHESIGTFFYEDGAEKQFCLGRGLEWTGGDVFDDYC
jgi:hypothetical protein